MYSQSLKKFYDIFSHGLQTIHTLFHPQCHSLPDLNRPSFRFRPLSICRLRSDRCTADSLILSDLSVSLEKSFIIIYVLLRHIASNLPSENTRTHNYTS